MFKRLIANLPFNPSLINQIGFYADRLRKETILRRLSFVMMALVVALQAFVVISPPERSLAYSSNHIQNGVRTKDDILAAYDDPNSDIKDIYTRFSLTRADIAALSTVPNVTIRSNDGSDWRTIGRSSLWNYGNVADVYKRGEIPIQYRGQDTPRTSDDEYVYDRSLRAWDIVNPYNTYAAFQGKSSTTGQDFWILLDCGNITWKGPWDTPDPVEPLDPKLEIKKSIDRDSSVLNPGDTFTYKITYRNKVMGTVAKDVFIEDQLDTKHFDVITPNDLNIRNGFLRQSVGDLRGTEKAKILEIPVRLKNPLPSGTRVCNVASILASNAPKVTSRPEVCVKVITPCPFDPTIPNINNPNCVSPVVVCEFVDAAINLATRTVKFKATATSTNPANTTIYKYTYDFGDGSAKVTNQSDKLVNRQEHTYQPGSYTAEVTINYSTTGENGRKEVKCSTSISFEDDEALGQAKTVRNNTQNLEGEAAEDSIVKAGDVLEYTLKTTNTQNYERTDITISDYIGDVLDYATLDIEALKATGGSFNETTKKVSWENVTVPANGTVQSVFKVTMLNPIPATNRPSTTSGDFDCSITNVYGNETTLSVQCPAVKGIETIPNTGPGTSMLAISGITLFVGYFFARSRLLSKEMQIIRTDYALSGGM